MASGDGAVRMWDMRTGQPHRTLLGHTAPVTCLQFDELHVVTGSLDKSIRVRVYRRPVCALELTAPPDLGPAHRRHLRDTQVRPRGHGSSVRHSKDRRRDWPKRD